MDFTTEAHLDEYVIDNEDTVSFSGSDGELTYNRSNGESETSVSISDANSIRFEQDDTHNRHTFLGVFFAVVALALTVLPSALIYLKTISSGQQALFVFFLYVFAVGAWNAVYEFLSHTDREVINIYINTDDETHVLCGDIEREPFVDACEELLDSDAPTKNHNPTLEQKLN